MLGQGALHHEQHAVVFCVLEQHHPLLAVVVAEPVHWHDST